MKRGRPSSYSPQVATAICEEIATTDHGLANICTREGMPSLMTAYRWLEADATFRELYARAKERQADFMAHQNVEIADSSDPADAAKVRLQIDARKWLAAKLAPRKYGDKLELAGDQANPIQSRVVVEFVGGKDGDS